MDAGRRGRLAEGGWTELGGVAGWPREGGQSWGA